MGDTAARAAFLRNTATGGGQRIDVSASGKNGNGSVYALALAASGAHVAFTGISTNLLGLPRGASGAQVYGQALPRGGCGATGWR